MAPPIGRMVNVFSDGMRLIGDVKFATAETYEFADTIFRMVCEGFLKLGRLSADRVFSFQGPGPAIRDRFSPARTTRIFDCAGAGNENALAQACAKGLLRYRDAERLGAGLFAGRDADRADRLRRVANLRVAPGRVTVNPPLVTTLAYAGTAEERHAQWRWEHRSQIDSDAAAERDLAIAGVDRDTAAGRCAIVAAYRRYQERLHHS
jgi:hypothetical protein